MRIRAQIADALRDHGVRLPKRQVEERIRDLLHSVGCTGVATCSPRTERGMKQRACIAIAISLRPRVILADEPTSAWTWWCRNSHGDAGTRQRALEASVILWARHGLVAQFVNRVGSCTPGTWSRSRRSATSSRSRSSYTRLLIAACRRCSTRDVQASGPPSLLRDLPSGCAFHPRCPHAVERCRTEVRAYRAGTASWRLPLALGRRHDHVVEARYLTKVFGERLRRSTPSRWRILDQHRGDRVHHRRGRGERQRQDTLPAAVGLVRRRGAGPLRGRDSRRWAPRLKAFATTCR